jgi:apolipoprotein N-acyltransferase
VLLAAAAGTVLALALPGLSWAPLLLLFPALWLELLERVARGRTALLLSWLAGTVHWAIASNWVVAVMHDFGGLPLLGALVCLLVMALILGFSWAVVGWLAWLVPAPWRCLQLACAWSAVEAARQLPPYLFPWNPTAAALAHLPPLLGSLPVWGATGLGWAVVAVGAGLWGVSRHASRRSGAVLAGSALLAILVCTLIAPRPEPSGETLGVAVLQPGTTLEQKWDPGQATAIAARVWQLTEQAAQADPAVRLVIWPESAVPYLLERDPLFEQRLVATAAADQVAIVLNSIGFNQDGGYANSAYMVTGEGVTTPRYDKVRLVPFGEYVPALFRVAFTESLVKEVASFEPGEAPALLTDGVPIGMSICYEIVFADLVAQQVKLGAELLVTITNDGWYGFSWAPEQHFAQAVLRAAESRRWVARAALTGISGFIDPAGRVTGQLDLGESGVLAATVQPMRGRTPRVALGDWWGVLCGLGAALLVIRARRRRRPAKGSGQ